MSTTWGALKTDIRSRLWPIGEAPELVAAHDKAFIDCIMDLQQWIECLQVDNVSLFPACSTYYQCGLTVFNAPRGFIKQVWVVAQPGTTIEPYYCAPIEYKQRAYKDVQRWIMSHGRDNFGMPLLISAFFGLPWASCRKPAFPIPTDAGVPAGLPPLSMGVHYPQGSTDRNAYRARSGVWAIERGKLYLAPWINVVTNPETVVVKWDGIKRTWGDDDPIDDDPLLSQALEEFVRADHARKYDRDMDVAQSAGAAFTDARTKLWKNCHDENRVRDREPSYAGGSAAALAASSLYTNTIAGVANVTADTSDCPAGETAPQTASASVTLPTGSVGSSISTADANAQAQVQAQAQAKALAISRLNCSGAGGSTGGSGTAGNGPTIYNQVQPDVVVSCSSTDPGAPPPSGASVTMQVAAGITSIQAASNSTSDIAAAQTQANSNAVAQVTQTAQNQLSCTWYNSAQTGSPATCLNNPAIIAPAVTVAANTSNSKLSQDDANQQALTAANNAAVNNLAGLGCTDNYAYNTPQVGTVSWTCNGLYTDSLGKLVRGNGTITVIYTVPANTFFAASVTLANAIALNSAQQLAKLNAQVECKPGQNIVVNLP